MDVQRLPWLPRDIVRQFNIAELIEKMRERNASLEPRQRRAETEMNAVPECDVGVRTSGKVEPVRIGNVCRIPVRRPHHHQDKAVLRNRATMHLHITRGLAEHHLPRRPESDDLLDGTWQERSLCAKHPLLIWMLQQRHHRIADEVRRRFRRGRKE